MAFDSLEEAIEVIGQGEMVIVVDDEERENEGDLVLAAEKVTPERVNFMAKHARGLICVPLTEERAEELGLSPMVGGGRGLEANFTVSVDARYGISTGISAYDRALTIQLLADPDAGPRDFVQPGHIFPLRAKPGGVLRRAGHTEASVDLARLARLHPAAVICEIMNDDGTMARVPELLKFAKRHRLKMISIANLIRYRSRREKLVRREASAELPTEFGHFRIIAYSNEVDDKEHVALVRGEVAEREDVLVRVHSECLTGDTFLSKRCDCGSQLHEALRRIEAEGRGVLLYIRQEGRGIGLINKIKAYALQDQGLDTVEANRRLGFKEDLRDYGIGAQILKDLGLSTIRLFTNNPKKVVGLEGYGLKIVEQVPLQVEPNEYNYQYLRTKKEKLGHLIQLPEERSG
jgi:3,4-dihydroxy 2-butanone 4-phosphate synthase/GTP cyclohydrolase II